MKRLIVEEIISRTVRNRGVAFPIPIEERRSELHKIGIHFKGTKQDRTRLSLNGREVQVAYAKEIHVVNNNPKLIFIVEDNTIYAKSLQYFLEDRLHQPEIRLFSQGESCIENLHFNPDFIIMDYFLNSREYNALNGLKTIRRKEDWEL